MNQMLNLPVETNHRPPRTPATAILDLFSSIWFGIVLAVVLFFYCSIGSAMPAVRQHRWLEMTEFEWFHWWPFNILILLFATVMIVATIRRVPLRKLNVGVWMIHTGIITLTLGSYHYFTTKVEGDAPVFRRQVTIEVPGADHQAALVALPGSETEVSAPSGTWRFAIQGTQNDWPILSEEDKGKKAYAVNVRVEPPSGDPFIRQLLAGYPQYTEDVIPGKGRAVKSTGKKLVEENLRLSLEYHATEYFHIMSTWALFVRRVGDKEWQERPIDGLPRYNDRIGARDWVFPDPHFELVPRAIDLPIPPAGGDALSSARVRATGYLRYAHMERRWRDGGDKLNPVLEINVLGAKDSFELLAMDPARNQAANGSIAFWWLDDDADIERLPTDSRATLQISVPAANVNQTIRLTSSMINGEFQPVERTEFAYRITGLQDNLSLPGLDRPASVAIIEIKTAEKTWRRWVSDHPQLTRDLPDTTVDPHSMPPAKVDDRITMSYRPSTSPLIFAAHPGGLHFVFNGEAGRAASRAVIPGEVLEVAPGLALKIESYVPRGVAEAKPVVVPPSQRNRDAGETFAMLRLELESAGSIQSKWIPFNQYAFPNQEYAYAGRFAYTPQHFRLADGSDVEVIFSRKRMKLPNPIAMEEFELDTHLGGYSGQVSTIRNYISKLRFLDNGKWTDPEPIAVNAPTEYAGLWYFQSTWDRPSSNDPGGGMNYTGLGIGNRHGVYTQLAGCCLAVAGMIFAFYIKPVLKRRRAAQQAARHFGHSNRTDELSSPMPSLGTPVEV